MKRFLAAIFLGGIVVGGANAKSLVAYFSRAGENYGTGVIAEGNTAIVAKMIASKTGSDIFEIVPAKAYPQSYSECIKIAKDEQKNNARPAISGNIDASGYDTIYLGYPNWWGDLPMCVYTFLESSDWSGKTVIPFCTHEGSGLGATESRLKKVLPGTTFKSGLAVQGKTAQSNRIATEKAVDGWLKKAGK